LIKKEAKRIVATIMNNIIKNLMNSNVFLEENLGEKIAENIIKDGGTLGKTCAGFAE
jgi:hypothetical protein